MVSKHLQSGVGVHNISSLGYPELLESSKQPLDLGKESTVKKNGKLRSYPSPEEWDNWTEFESGTWPKKTQRNYWIIYLKNIMR